MAVIITIILLVSEWAWKLRISQRSEAVFWEQFYYAFSKRDLNWFRMKDRANNTPNH
jgi:hypothetical protein